VPGDDTGDDYNESAGRSTDLKLGTTEQRNQKSAYDCRVNSSLRSDTRSDTEGHGQRQRHQTDGDSGNQIREQVFASIVLQHLEGLRRPVPPRNAQKHGHLALVDSCSISSRIVTVSESRE
jgi:hypothetical protein